MFNIEILSSKSLEELTKICKDLGIKISRKSTANEVVFAILDFQAANAQMVKEYYQQNFASEEKPKQEKSPAKKKPTEKKTTKSTKNATPTISDSEKIEEEQPEATSEEAKTPKPTRKRIPKTSENKEQPTADTSTEKKITQKETAPESSAEPKDPKTSQKRPQKKQKQQNTTPETDADNGTSPAHPPKDKTEDKPAPKKDFNFDNIVTIEGVLEILPDNYGFLRSSDFNYLSSPDDVFVSTSQIRNYGLKTGDTVRGIVRLPKEGEKYFSLQTPLEVNGRDLSFIKDRVAFEYLTPIFPQERFNLAGNHSTLSTRIVDLFAPIGKGQRAMIVAQPKTGKTMLLKDIANSISANHPEAYMMILLIDERPEEVTDMQRSVNAEVIASTFDESADKHTRVANLVLSKAQRMVECGHDVVILLDSITRLARAYNTVTPASGKILSGGVDANALHRPKRFFGAARNIENGGSLTIIATALIDTGSKMDEVIFEEFKGTGNMELQLDRKIANRRIFPAADLIASSTRRDDLLHDEDTQQKMWGLRKYLSEMHPLEAAEFIQKHMKDTRDNEEFLLSMVK